MSRRACKKIDDSGYLFNKIKVAKAAWLEWSKEEANELHRQI